MSEVNVRKDLTVAQLFFIAHVERQIGEVAASAVEIAFVRHVRGHENVRVQGIDPTDLNMIGIIAASEQIELPSSFLQAL